MEGSFWANVNSITHSTERGWQRKWEKRQCNALHNLSMALACTTGSMCDPRAFTFNGAFKLKKRDACWHPKYTSNVPYIELVTIKLPWPEKTDCNFVKELTNVKQKNQPPQKKPKTFSLTVDLLSLGVYAPRPQVSTYGPQILREVRIWDPFQVPVPGRRIKRFRRFKIGRR